MWRTSSHSTFNGNCVEADSWRTSSRSGTGNCLEVAARCQTSECVEVGRGEAVLLVRDTQDRGGPRLVLTPQAWTAFTARIKTGPVPR